MKNVNIHGEKMKTLQKFSTIAALVILIACFSVYAQKGSPKTQGLSNLGNEFWFSLPPAYQDSDDPEIRVYVWSATHTNVTVEVPTKGYLRTKSLVPFEADYFELTEAMAYAASKEPKDDPLEEMTYTGSGIHISSDEGIFVYCFLKSSSSSEGFLVIPVNSLGTEYFISGYTEDPMFSAVWGYRFPSTACIVATEDRTKMRFTMGGNILSTTGAGVAPGTVVNVTLNSGDVWLVMADGEGADLTGSAISSNKPVAVTTGNPCANIPEGNQWCDYIAEMLLPTEFWGMDYHVVKIPGRKYPPIVRVLAESENTKIFRDGKQIALIPDAGGIEGKGWQEMRLGPMLEDQSKSAVISGDKPIGVMLYNPGVQEDDYPLPQIDPFMMCQIPYDQYSRDMIFYVPGRFFDTNRINLVYQTDETGLITDDIKLGRFSGGSFQWQNLNAIETGPGEIFESDVDGKTYAARTIALSDEGVYRIKADDPFAAYSFGFSYSDGYAFPSGFMSVPSMTISDFAPPETEYKYSCGDYEGKVWDMPRDPDIMSGLKSIGFDPQDSYNYQFTFDNFQEGTTDSIAWFLKLINVFQPARAVLIFEDMAENQKTFTLTYDPPAYKVVPQSHLEFRNIRIGKEYVRNISIHNDCGRAINIAEIRLAKGNEGFEMKYSGGLPYSLGKDESFEIEFTFMPTAEDTYHDTLIISDICSIQNKFVIFGNGVEPLINAGDADFDTLYSSRTASRDLDVSNTGSTKLVITGYSGPSESVYDLPDMINISTSNPLQLNPGEKYTYRVNFTPDSARCYPDSIIFHSDATGLDSIAYLNGCGADIDAIPDLPAIEKSLSITPNPADEQFTLGIDLPEPAEAEISISDIQGRIVYVPFRKKLLPAGRSSLKISAAQLPPGAFILTIELPGGKLNKKLNVVR